jgi:threonine/homoserine/homoserine lactone efflux protein
MNTLLSMSAFALASSISPGPVNIVALGAGARHGFAASLRHVTGATVGFTVLLVLTGLGIRQLAAAIPQLTAWIQWAGAAFLAWMAWRLAIDDGHLVDDHAARGPNWWQGAAMQWLNPKAWLASLAGMGAFAANGDRMLVWQFAAIYFLICYASIASWAWAGTCLRHVMREPRRVRLFNRAMAALIVASTVYMLVA